MERRLILFPMATPSIVVVGSYARDLVFGCPEFPRPGETVMGWYMTAHGGKGSNQAVAAARAGGKVVFIGGIGRDAFGDEAREFHAAEGINCRASVKIDRPTGTASIAVNQQGQNQIIVAPGANEALSPADIDAHAGAIRGAGMLVVQLEANLDAAAHAMRLARESGVTVLLNPAPMRADFDLALLARVDILIPNETEFAALVNRLPPAPVQIAGAAFDEHRIAALSDDELHALCRRFEIGTVIVTLGRRGCFVSRSDGHTLLPAVPGVVAVDTTGAGDAFVGAFAAALAEFGPGGIEQAARFANAGAAISVTRPGAAPAMARREEIEAAMRQD